MCGFFGRACRPVFLLNCAAKVRHFSRMTKILNGLEMSALHGLRSSFAYTFKGYLDRRFVTCILRGQLTRFADNYVDGEA